MTAIHSVQAAGDVVRLLQITDTHLREEPGGTLLGLDTDFSLDHVIELARASHPGPDLVLATGDISDHGSESAYQRARDYFQRLGGETLWLAGNHDRHDLMVDVFGNGGELVRAARVGGWLLVLLNSQVPGEVGGELGAAELGWLGQCLQQAAAEQCLRDLQNRGMETRVVHYHLPTAA